ncbi:hypothetical protein JCM5353_004706 [Sporobolomyces roseus]
MQSFQQRLINIGSRKHSREPGKEGDSNDKEKVVAVKRTRVDLTTTAFIDEGWKAIAKGTTVKSDPSFDYYPPSSSPTRPLPPSPRGAIYQLPYASPSNLEANSIGNVFPSAYNQIAINSKQVPAVDRVFKAPRPNLPPYPPFDVGHSYSEASIQRHNGLMAMLPTSKRRDWGTALKKYHEWCSMEGIPDQQRYPITTWKIKMFLPSLISTCSGETVKRNVGWLREYSSWISIPWEVDEQLLKPTYDTLKNFQPHPRLRRKPLLAQHLLPLIALTRSENPSLSNNYELGMVMATCVGFAGLLRSGEFTVKSMNSDPEEMEKKVKRKHLSDVEGNIKIHLPWDKVKQWNGADVVVSTSALNGEAVRLLRQHLIQNSVGPEDFLFSYVAQKGRNVNTRVNITKVAWLRWLNNRLSQLGLPSMTGHSIRIGGATQLLLNGVNPTVVKNAGRWSGNSFEVYWRHITLIRSLEESVRASRVVPIEVPI